MKSSYNQRRSRGLCGCGARAELGSKCTTCWFAGIAYANCGSRKYGFNLKLLIEKQKYRCALSGETLILGKNASIDHKVPLSRGGSNLVSNLHWVSEQVNRMKTDMTIEEFKKRCKDILVWTTRPHFDAKATNVVSMSLEDVEINQ